MIGIGVAQGASLLRMFVAARVLGPAVYGAWLGLRLIVDYGSSLDFGVLTAMLRNYALLVGRGDEAGARKVRATAFTFAMTTGVVAALVLTGIAFAWPRPEERKVLAAIATLLVVNLGRSYFVVHVKANQEFSRLAFSSVCGGVTTLVTLPLISAWGLSGLVWGMVCQGLAEIASIAHHAGVPRLRMSWDTLKVQLQYGLPCTATAFAFTLLSSMDRTLILQMLGAEHLGRYGVAFICGMISTIVASVPSIVTSPRLARRYGETGRASDLGPVLLGALPQICVAGAIAAGAGAIAIPPLVHRLLPKYLEGVRAAQIIVISGYLLAPIGLAASCLAALHQLKRYGAVLLGAAGVTYVLGRLLLFVRPTLTMVAVAVALGLMAYLVAILVLTCRAIAKPMGAVFEILAMVGKPLLLAIACVVIVEGGVARIFVSGSFALAAIGEVILLMAMGVAYRRMVRDAVAAWRRA